MLASSPFASCHFLDFLPCPTPVLLPEFLGTSLFLPSNPPSMDSIFNHSSSDRSYSPPASRTSTRNTTPDFGPSVSTASRISGLRICGMEASNSFQGSDHRYSGEMPPVAFRRYNQQQQYHHQQHQVSMRPMVADSPAPRSLDAPNWRVATGMGNGLAQGRGHYHTLSSTSGPEYMVMGTPAMERQTATDQCWDIGDDTSGFFAYCLDRGNGNYTRLIPADMLPPLVGIPAVQHGAESMVVLPAPRALDPQIPSGGTIQPVAFKVWCPFLPSLPRHPFVGAERLRPLHRHRHRSLMLFR